MSLALRELYKKISAYPWVPGVITILGAGLFFARLWFYAHTQASVLDEGLYLYKGLLYARGLYRPFQDYGFFVHQMPLADLIPGYLQMWFGAGLRTGRYFAILFAILMLLFLWITARRLGGKWIGAAVIWAVAINTAPIKMYSQAISQGIVACMLMAVMALTLGKKQFSPAVVYGAFISGLIIVTRIDLLPVLPLIWLYIFWQYGKRAGTVCVLVSLVPVLLIHAIFWPDILKIYAAWLPNWLAQFLSSWKRPADVIPAWGSTVSFSMSFDSISRTVSEYFYAILGVFIVWVLWPAQKNWESKEHFKASVFLSSAIIALASLHIIYVVRRSSTYGLQMYFAFYYGLALLLVAVSFKSWRRIPGGIRKKLALFLLTGLFIVVSFDYLRLVGYEHRAWFIDITRSVLNIKVPRIRNQQVLPGTAKVWQVITNKFGIPEDVQWVEMVYSVLPAIYLIVLIVAGLAFVYLLIKAWGHFLQKDQPGYAIYTMLVLFLVSSAFASPSVFLGGKFQNYDCSGDVIRSAEKAGTYLAQILTPQARIYWSFYSPVPLLYGPDLTIFPPQFDLSFSYSTGGKPEETYRYGYWNDELSHQWLKEAEYVLIGKGDYKGWLKAELESGRFTEISPSPNTLECKDSAIYIFKKK